MIKMMLQKRLSSKITTSVFALFLTVLIFLVNSYVLKLAWWVDYLLAVNISSLLFYLYDKIQAAQHKFRVPEITLLLLLMIGGDIGALIGIFRGRHKTQSDNFLAPALGIILLHLVTIVALVYLKTKS